MKRYGYWLIAGLLCLGAVVAHAQEQKSEDYVQAVTAYLQQKTGKAPQPQEIVNILSSFVSGTYQEGDYRTGVTAAEQAYQVPRPERRLRRGSHTFIRVEPLDPQPRHPLGDRPHARH